MFHTKYIKTSPQVIQTNNEAQTKVDFFKKRAGSLHYSGHARLINDKMANKGPYSNGTESNRPTDSLITYSIDIVLHIGWFVIFAKYQIQNSLKWI